MPDVTAYALSKHLSDLIGRKVSFTVTTASPETKIKQIYGIYTVLPYETMVLVKTDLPLLGSLAGVLVGLPDSAVKEHLAASSLDELMRDAMHEVLNVTSTVVSKEGRPVFQKMVSDASLVDGPAGKLLVKPDHRSYFNVAVDGYQGGKFQLFSQFIPGKLAGS
jgi:hypothetical protein